MLTNVVRQRACAEWERGDEDEEVTSAFCSPFHPLDHSDQWAIAICHWSAQKFCFFFSKVHVALGA